MTFYARPHEALSPPTGSGRAFLYEPLTEREREMRVFFDTEFIEDGRTIDLISIGLVREDGRSYYAEAAECDLTRASDWVKANVLPHLFGQKTPRKQIASEIVHFVGATPEFWAYYADYDWVALCQLFGTMMDLPEGWPMYCRDLKQWCDSRGNPRLPKQELTEHHALNDAHWTREAYHFLRDLSAPSRKIPVTAALSLSFHAFPHEALSPPTGSGEAFLFEG